MTTVNDTKAKSLLKEFNLAFGVEQTHNLYYFIEGARRLSLSPLNILLSGPENSANLKMAEKIGEYLTARGITNSNIAVTTESKNLQSKNNFQIKLS